MVTYAVHRPAAFRRSATWSPFSLISSPLRHGFSPAPCAGEPAFQGTLGVYPPVNLHETKEGYVLTAELPGVEPDAIDVSIEGSTVTLSGERKIDYSAQDSARDSAENAMAVHRRERQSGTFRRAFELPTEIDLDQARATHKNGVLRLSLPKSAAAKPRQIAIETR